jgi:hypothetical protein
MPLTWVMPGIRKNGPSLRSVDDSAVDDISIQTIGL